MRKSLLGTTGSIKACVTQRIFLMQISALGVIEDQNISPLYIYRRLERLYDVGGKSARREGRGRENGVMEIQTQLIKYDYTSRLPCSSLTTLHCDCEKPVLLAGK